MTSLFRIALLLGLAATVSGADRYRHGHPIHIIWVSDRVSYEIIDEHTEGSEDPRRCGYRPATYRIEVRLYHEYRGGFMIRTWQTEVPVFLGCGGVY